MTVRARLQLMRRGLSSDERDVDSKPNYSAFTDDHELIALAEAADNALVDDEEVDSREYIAAEKRLRRAMDLRGGQVFTDISELREALAELDKLDADAGVVGLETPGLRLE